MTIHSTELLSFGALLKHFRTSRRLTQQQLATAIGVHRHAIGRWEQGEVLPATKTMILELARHLHLDDQETRHLLETSLTALSPYFLVPLPRNPFFTGREEILEALHTQLGVEQTVALTQSSALHGLGGVGKTQIALEYAYRHALEYSAVFWIGAETNENIISSLVHIAEVLRLPEREDKDQQRVVAAVQRWLSLHGQWLLVWDNLENLDLFNRFLPATRSGAMLITTRRQVLGTLVWGVNLPPMAQEEGVLFLLRRTKVLSPEATSEQVRQLAIQAPAQYAAASELATLLGGLPLALDQAGAYLEETHCGLPAYLDLFRSQRDALLQRRGEGIHDHPASVSTTLRLSITAAAECHPAVRDLLQICALLQPDAIPEELFRQGGEHLGPLLQAVCCDPLEWDRLVGSACSYSLLYRQSEEHTLSLHRLVQVVLLDTMTEAEQEQWNRRVIKALDSVFPDMWNATASAVWKQCGRLLPHVLVSLYQGGGREEALTCASLNYKTACSLYQRGQYPEAERLYQQALQIQQQALGPEHPEVGATLNKLAGLSVEQGRHPEAERLYQQALQIQQQALGPEHPEVGATLNDLATLFSEQGRYPEAERFHQQALQIEQQALGPEHPEVGATLNTLGRLYLIQGKYEAAESFFLQSLQIWEQAWGPEDPDVAYALHGLAEVCRELGRYEAAESFFLRALHIREQRFGSEHPKVAEVLHGLAALSLKQERLEQAERFSQRARALREKFFGQQHPETAETLHDLAVLRRKQGELIEARTLAERALDIRAQALGNAHPKTIATRMLCAQLVQEKAEEAEPPLEDLRTLLKARGWSLHLKKRHDKPYVYATRKEGQRTQSRYLAPLSNLAACLAAARTLPNAREE